MIVNFLKSWIWALPKDLWHFLVSFGWARPNMKFGLDWCTEVWIQGVRRLLSSPLLSSSAKSTTSQSSRLSGTSSRWKKCFLIPRLKRCGGRSCPLLHLLPWTWKLMTLQRSLTCCATSWKLSLCQSCSFQNMPLSCKRWKTQQSWLDEWWGHKSRLWMGRRVWRNFASSWKPWNSPNSVEAVTAQFWWFTTLTLPGNMKKIPAAARHRHGGTTWKRWFELSWVPGLRSSQTSRILTRWCIHSWMRAMCDTAFTSQFSVIQICQVSVNFIYKSCLSDTSFRFVKFQSISYTNPVCHWHIIRNISVNFIYKSCPLTYHSDFICKSNFNQFQIQVLFVIDTSLTQPACHKHVL